MRTTGIIAEFNPLHTGHISHIEETRARFGGKIIVAMSGNFVQRGEPAMCDKFRRTRMALMAGADIVLEIPVPYVIAGADFFARGSVGVLAATGVAEALSFGSECGDIAAIREAGRLLAEEPPEYKNILRENLDAGKSFAAARGAALSACMDNAPENLFTAPNNCLAIEYCKALHLLENPMEIFTTHRTSGGPSATKIRKKFFAGEDFAADMPGYAAEILHEAREKAETAMLDDFGKIFRYLLYTRDFDLGEGLENRFRKFCGDYPRLSDLIDAVKTKRYTRTRLCRAVLCAILNIVPREIGDVQYIRVLGFRKESADLLGAITEKAALPVITRASAAPEMLAKDFEAGDIYRIATNSPGGYRSERGAELIRL